MQPDAGADVKATPPALTKQAPIEPEIYNEFIQQLKPLDITLVGSGFQVSRPGSGALRAVAQSSPAEIVDGFDPTASADECITAIKQKIEFAVLDASGVEVASGDAEYVLRIQTNRIAPASFWRVFLVRNMPLYINPATRDFIASMSARANLTVQLIPSVSVVPFRRKEAD